MILECGGRIPRCTARVSPAWSGSHWDQLCLCDATPVFHELFAKSAGFFRRRGPCGRHSELQNCGSDSIFVSLRCWSGRSLKRHHNFSPSATLLIRMVERLSSRHLSHYRTEVAKKWSRNPGKCPRPARILIFQCPDQENSSKFQ